LGFGRDDAPDPRLLLPSAVQQELQLPRRNRPDRLLDALGVTDVYASPFLVARPGSAHGYDVIDHAHLNPEIGTDGDLEALSAALKQRGMG
jgi:(1->4)-alpha-D-glucan 1-alpha-D-glucosylmutase